MTDANGSVHDYSYDEAGRRITDVVATLGSGVDGSVRRIEHGYDSRMRLETITSYDATIAGSVESEIQYDYNDFGQVTKEYQQHGAAVNVSTSPVVEYDYADGSANTIRMSSMTYPDGRELDYGYGTSGSESDLLDRVVTIKDGATTLVTYDHSGSGSVVTQTYNQPGIEKTLALGSGSDPYSALDRFGRMIDLRWKKGSTDLASFEYDYDRVSNRLIERNKISTGSNPNVDSLFEFDELNRMTDFKTGLLNAGGDAIPAPEMAQSITLDETGNFKNFSQTVVDAVTQTRTHNKVNEITNITETVGDAWASPAHDDAGNMTSIPQPSDLTDGYDATWDAWHRLVKLEDGAATVAVYEYDGNNRRIIKQVYTAGSLDETRHVYYTSQSQAIEERVDSSTDAEIQFVWNLGYVDDQVLRDRDTTANGALDERLYSLPDLRFSVVALANTSGTILERFKYDGHGKTSVLSDLFASRSSSLYDWEFRYTGRREDLETGLLFFRARYYSAELGRFISRDPLGFVDGMSLYRAYFLPGGVDPFGLKFGDPCKLAQGPLITWSGINTSCNRIACLISRTIFRNDPNGREAWHRFTAGDGTDWELTEKQMAQIARMNFGKEMGDQKRRCCEQGMSSTDIGYRLMKDPWKTSLGTVKYDLFTACSGTTCDSGSYTTTLEIDDWYDWNSNWLWGKPTHRSPFGEIVTVAFDLAQTHCKRVWTEYAIYGTYSVSGDCK